MTETLTLAFEFDALCRLADPEEAVGDADDWSRHVGLADVAPNRTTALSARVDVDPDFIASLTGESDGLAVVTRQYPTTRHVLVGTTCEGRRAARSLGWEYVALETAAEHAGWPLAADDDRWRAEADSDGPTT